MKSTKLTFAFTTLLAITSCFYKPAEESAQTSQEHPIVEPSQIGETKQQESKPHIDDLVNFSQHPLSYVDMSERDKILISSEELDKFMNTFKRRFYRVWTAKLNIEEAYTIHQAEIDKYSKNPGIGENKLSRDSLFAVELRNRTNLENGFNSLKKGIMTNYAYIRAVPTIKPFYLDFALAGEGYPFDYWQSSTIPIGTPIFIYHEHENWALIESHICSGWVPRNYIAYLDDKTIDAIITAPKIAITKDRTALYNMNNKYIAHADIGTVFSLAKEHKDFYEAMFIHKNELNNGILSNIKVDKHTAEKIPIPLTAFNIATLCTEMMNQVYGWGGLYFNRDCSQSLLDIFIGFGILLPRNGRQQAYNFGTFYNMGEIEDLNDRKKEIVEKSIPFLTMVRTPGHIMLYVGHIEGEPLVFHTIWGLRTIEDYEKDGRFIIGRTVITSLEPGKELKNINPNTMLINRLEGITHFTP